MLVFVAMTVEEGLLTSNSDRRVLHTVTHPKACSPNSLTASIVRIFTANK